jgi:hypothetical protein
MSDTLRKFVWRIIIPCGNLFRILSILGLGMWTYPFVYKWADSFGSKWANAKLYKQADPSVYKWADPAS